MGFRNRLSSASGLDTGNTGQGVRITKTGGREGGGAVELYPSITGAPGILEAGSDQEAGPYAALSSPPRQDGRRATALLAAAASWISSPGVVYLDGELGNLVRRRRDGNYVDPTDWPIARLRQLVQSGTYAAGFGTISFGVADQDTHGGFVIPSGSTFSDRWTCPAGQDGLYAVEGRPAVLSVTAGNSATSRLLKNGAAIPGTLGDIIRQRDTDSALPATGRQVFPLAAGDFVQLQGFVSVQTWGTRVTADGVASILTIERIA